MKQTSVALCAVLLLSPVCFAQKKELVELQRDVALLQDQIRTMQKAFEEKLNNLQTLVQQAVDSTNKANTYVAKLDAGQHERMDRLDKSIAGPVAGLNTRMDQMGNAFQGVKESVADLTARMTKMQNQLTDLSNAVKTLSAPPPPPSTSSPPPGVSAQSLYESAMRDRSSGNADLAIQQFKDYLRFFAETDLAPNAQFYIGELLFFKSDYDGALEAFDAILERFPDSQKVPDTLYMKGRTLIKAGQKSAAAQEYRSLIKRFPSNELSAKARAELKSMGLSATTPKKR